MGQEQGRTDQEQVATGQEQGGTGQKQDGTGQEQDRDCYPLANYFKINNHYRLRLSLKFY